MFKKKMSFFNSHNNRTSNINKKALLFSKNLNNSAFLVFLGQLTSDTCPHTSWRGKGASRVYA